MKKPTSTVCVSGVWLLSQRLLKARPLWLGLLWVLLMTNTTLLSGNCVISCRDINISLDQNGQAILSPAFVLADPSCDPGEFTLQIFNPANQQISDTLDCSSVGEVLNVQVIHQATGNRCWSEVTVQDYFAPVIDCQDTLLFCTQTTDPNVIGFPNVSDNCTPFSQLNLTYSDIYEDLPCYYTYLNDSVTAHIERTWRATDAQGNEMTCIQHIYLKRATVADVVFPENRDGFAAPKLNCLDDPTDLNLTGVPTIAGRPIDINGACELVVSFSDQNIPQCGTKGEKILRTWTVIDWCSGDFNLDVQLISVSDTTAPVIVCPANITVSTDYYDCSATVVLPSTTATDDCSAISIQPSWDFGSGYGPFYNVPAGVHEVVYTATDACGNQDTCRMHVTVLDQLAPVAVCDATTVVAIGNNGTAYVNVWSFDDGSYDNCALGLMEVRRENGVFGSQVYFDCSDVGQNIPITLRVHDQAGNYNECTVLAEVKDLWRPAINCPGTIYLDCSDDYLDTDLTGVPIITENCLLDTFFFVDQPDLNVCGIGEVRRRWWARDAGGNESWCDQLIYIGDTTPFDIIFPQDYLSEECIAFVSPDSSGEPQILGTDCELVGVTYSDQVFPISGTSCYKIFRTWTVVDWCTYVANSGSDEGSWTHTQLITVRDKRSPDLTCPADTIVAFWGSDCNQGMLVNLPDIEVDDCDTAVVVVNDSPFAFQSGRNASGNYPPGNHTITFYATDGCGNTSFCSMLLQVVDAKPPDPVCEASISVGLNLEAYVIVDPALLTIYVDDNCSAPAQISIELSRDSFTCDDLGAQVVEVTYIDEAGNQASCNVIVNITDGLGVCPSSSIAGVIRTEKGQELAGAHVYLEGNSADVITTNSSGTFQFDQLPIGGDFSVTPEKDTLHRNGISTFDLILISKHIVGLSRFPSPYQVIAADVNNSGSVSTFDVIELRKMILYINEQFPRSPSWRFIPEAYTFTNPANPFSSGFPESLSYQELGTSIDNANFVAIKIGDVNGSARTNYLQTPATGQQRSQEVFPLGVCYKPGKIPGTRWMELHFTDKKSLSGLQFSLNISPQNILAIENGRLNDLSPANFYQDEQRQLLNLSWHTTKAAEVRKGDLLFRILLNGAVKDIVETNETLNAEAYVEHDGNLEIWPIFLKEEKLKEEPVDQEVFTCFPTLVHSRVTFNFNLIVPRECTLQVFDQQGRLVFESGAFYETGEHELKLDRAQLGRGYGNYFCRLKKGDHFTKAIQFSVVK